MRSLLFPVALAFIFLPLSARADSLDVAGFSPDGAYVAIVEHGIGEGSGQPWARLGIVEVAKSAQVAHAEVNLDAGTEEDAVAQVKKKAEPAQAKLHIDKWLPAKLIRHDEKGQMSDHEDAPIGTLEIKSRKATAKERARACDQPFSPLLLKVTVFFLDDEKPATLFAERKVPQGRACSTGCALDQIYAFKKSAVVTVKCGAPGFEGPASKLWPVAGKLPYGLDEDLPAQ